MAVGTAVVTQPIRSLCPLARHPAVRACLSSSSSIHTHSSSSGYQAVRTPKRGTRGKSGRKAVALSQEGNRPSPCCCPPLPLTYAVSLPSLPNTQSAMESRENPNGRDTPPTVAQSWTPSLLARPTVHLHIHPHWLLPSVPGPDDREFGP
ncbi:hypothetical protein B0T18DRAFT_181822 [Schizothecium vesticola]|uniref:Uncharacterized protein n=1 Tax=Schizothecium vesticola TaxID=314040 RepID=A0AA40EPV1_9PEZI|nr:hypothetical protein B0T18DRAFT_181822 [Schizothecium vesticola]